MQVFIGLVALLALKNAPKSAFLTAPKAAAYNLANAPKPAAKTTGNALKSTVYIETSIISYLTARQNNDLRAMANKSATMQWWELQKPKFILVVSEFVIAEASNTSGSHLGQRTDCSQRFA